MALSALFTWMQLSSVCNIFSWMHIYILIFCYFDYIFIDADNIFKASEKGDVARVRALVASGKYTNSRDDVRRRG
jgi:hypothetical protein